MAEDLRLIGVLKRIVTLVLCLCPHPIQLIAEPSGSPTLQEIHELRIAEVEGLGSIRVVWQAEHVYRRGSLNDHVEMEMESNVRRALGDVPPKEVVLRGTESLIIQGGSSRYETTLELWNISTNTISPDQHTISLYHNGIGKRLVDKGRRLSISETINPLDNPSALAVSAIYDVDYLGASDTKLARIQETSEGKMWVIEVPQSGGYRKEYFLDPSRNGLLTRFLILAPDGPYREMKYKYDDDPTRGRVPKVIEITALKKDRSGTRAIAWRGTLKILETEYNGPIDGSWFHLTAPDGYRVYDQVAGVDYVAGELPGFF